MFSNRSVGKLLCENEPTHLEREGEGDWVREKQASTLPVRSQIGGENGSRWQCESSITAPQGELQLKLLWSAICQLLRSSQGDQKGAVSPPISSYPAHKRHVNMCRCACQNNPRPSSQGHAYFHKRSPLGRILLLGDFRRDIRMLRFL